MEESVLMNPGPGDSQGMTQTPATNVKDLLLRMEKMLSDVSGQQEQGVERICQHINTGLAQQQSAIAHVLKSPFAQAKADMPQSTLSVHTSALRRAAAARKGSSPRLASTTLFEDGCSSAPTQAALPTEAKMVCARTEDDEFPINAPAAVVLIDDGLVISKKGVSFTNLQDAQKDEDNLSNTGLMEMDSTATAPTQPVMQLQRFSVYENQKKQVATNDERKVILMKAISLEAPGEKVVKKVIASPWFDSTCAIVLLSNAVFIGIQVEHRATTQSTSAPVAHLAIDILYTVIFMCELSLRMYAMGLFAYFIGIDRNWNIFDFVVVIIGAVDNIITLTNSGSSSSAMSSVSVLRIVRVIRVVRVVRVFRLMKFFRSLRMLINAIMNTVKNCVWTSLLLCMILYIFGILFAQQTIDYLIETDPQLLKEREMTPLLQHYFSTLPRSIFTCLKSILGGIDWEPAAQALSDLGPFYVFMFIVLIIFVYLAVLNVISGLFIQSSLEEAQQDLKHIIAMEVTGKQKFTERFEAVFKDMDTDQTGDISLDEFEHALGKPGMQNLLEAMGVEASDAWTLFKLLDTDGGGTVDKDEFLEGCLSLKGPAKSIHIAQQRYESKWLIDAVLKLSIFVEQASKDLSDRQGVMLEWMQLDQEQLDKLARSSKRSLAGSELTVSISETSEPRVTLPAVGE